MKKNRYFQMKDSGTLSMHLLRMNKQEFFLTEPLLFTVITKMGTDKIVVRCILYIEYWRLI